MGSERPRIDESEEDNFATPPRVRLHKKAAALPQASSPIGISELAVVDNEGDNGWPSQVDIETEVVDTAATFLVSLETKVHVRVLSRLVAMELGYPSFTLFATDLDLRSKDFR